MLSCYLLCGTGSISIANLIRKTLWRLSSRALSKKLVHTLQLIDGHRISLTAEFEACPPSKRLKSPPQQRRATLFHKPSDIVAFPEIVARFDSANFAVFLHKVNKRQFSGVLSIYKGLSRSIQEIYRRTVGFCLTKGIWFFIMRPISNLVFDPRYQVFFDRDGGIAHERSVEGR